MSNKTLIEWNADVGTRFLTIHPDGSFDINEDTPPLYALGELAKAFIRQQERIKRLEEDLGNAYAEIRKQYHAITAVYDRSVWDKAKEAKP